MQGKKKKKFSDEVNAGSRKKKGSKKGKGENGAAEEGEINTSAEGERK